MYTVAHWASGHRGSNNEVVPLERGMPSQARARARATHLWGRPVLTPVPETDKTPLRWAPHEYDW